MLLPEKEQRPGAESETLSKSFAGDPLSVLTYCTRCGHLLTARSSVSRGVGPVCIRFEVVA
ncbi:MULTISPECIES: DUF6011 domain-containing protein [Actinomycetes]|uniref:Uncharacterized protein n=1 Tax=Streptomyces rhizosphaericus TaxID=114699 RepID=A0ABN1SWF8_9ACTN